MAKVLVIEDNPSNMTLATFLLESAGHSVLGATDAEAGMVLAHEELPDLILMDIQLPGIDGLEATRRIRASKKSASIPIIAITSYAMSGDRERLLAEGCSGYIEKPINPETIMAELNTFLAEKSGRIARGKAKTKQRSRRKSDESPDCG